MQLIVQIYILYYILHLYLQYKQGHRISGGHVTPVAVIVLPVLRNSKWLNGFVHFLKEMCLVCLEENGFNLLYRDFKLWNRELYDKSNIITNAVVWQLRVNSDCK